MRRSDTQRRWRPVRWLRLVARRGWRFEFDLRRRPNVLVSPRGNRFEFRRGYARPLRSWWDD